MFFAIFLTPGIEENIADLTGCALAGSSTALGFFAVQNVENVIVPKGKNWVD